MSSTQHTQLARLTATPLDRIRRTLINFFTNNGRETRELFGCHESKRQWDDRVWRFMETLHRDIMHITNCACMLKYTETAVLLMQRVAFLLEHLTEVFLSTATNGIYDQLALTLHACLEPCLKRKDVRNLIADGRQKCVDNWKKALKKSLCVMSSNYLSTPGSLPLIPVHPSAAVDTLIFKTLHDLVVNDADKRVAMFFLCMLPKLMGAPNQTNLLQSLSMQMHTFIDRIIKSMDAAGSNKFIRMHFGAAGNCTCPAKCSVYGNVDDIQVMAICKTCRNSPVYRQQRQQRCRRTISSTSYVNTCSVDGNTSFVYVPIYRAVVNKRNGEFLYEHWAYTSTFRKVLENSDTASIYMLCSGGSRSCTNVFLTDSLAATQCKACKCGNSAEKTCLTEKIGQKMAALCDGCIISACCPIHAQRNQKSINLWLSILEWFSAP